MYKYADTITPEILVANYHFSDAEIERDIAETIAEIDQYLVMGVAYLKAGNAGSKLFYHRYKWLSSPIEERADFVVFLRKLLDARKEQREKSK